MALEYNYNSLSAAIQNWVEDESIELVDDAIPSIIGLAEQRILKDLQLSTFDAILSGSFVANNPNLSKPADMVQAVNLYLVKNQYHTIAAQDETDFDGAGSNGSFTGGTGYAAADTITMSDGTVVTVDTVSSGVITEFTVTTATPNGSGNLKSGQTLTQSSTSGSGTGLTLTLGDNNETLDTVASKRERLSERTMSFLNDYEQGDDSAGVPVMFTDLDEDTWKVTPIPDFAYTYEAQAIIRPDSLLEFETIAAQDETDFDGVGDNGTFTGGTGYAGGNTITMSDGTVITVDTVSGGVVTEFTVTSKSTSGGTIPNAVLTQSSTSGGGTGFTLTLGDDNETPDGTRTSWISTRLAELLFYACQIESERFIIAGPESADRPKQWEEQYNRSATASALEMQKWTRERYVPMPPNQGGTQ